MAPIRNTFLNALVEIERRLLFCQSAYACYTQVIELVGSASGAAHTCLIEFDLPSVESSDSSSDLVSNAVPKPKRDRGCHQAMRAVTTWSAGAVAIDGAALLAEPGLAHWLMRLKQGDTIQKTDSDCLETEQQILASYGICAILLLPLVVHQQVQGAIGMIYQFHTPSWDNTELEIWQGVALILAAKLEQLQTTASIAPRIQSAQLMTHLETLAQQQTQRLQKMLEFEALLRRITDRVRDSLDEGQILQTAVQELAIGLATYSCDTGRYNWEQGTSTIAHEFIRSPHIPSAQGLVFRLSDHLDIYSQLLQGRSLQFCWIVSPVHPRPLNQPVSVLCCPILDDQTVIGDIWLYDAADIYFDMESVRLVEQVANQCAIAVRQARLYQAAQAQVCKLEQLNGLKDEFLNTVSHELRSPMANIEMAIQMLELLLFPQPTGISHDSSRPLKATTDACSDQCRSSHHSTERFTDCRSIDALPHPTSFQQSIRYFRMLQDECHRETNLINDLLNLSRLEAGTEPIVLTTISLQVWIPHVIEPFLERARCQSQQLQVEISEALPPVPVDLRSLERILTELVHNACKYTPPGGEIRVMVDHIPSRPPTDPNADRASPSCVAPSLNLHSLETPPQLRIRVSNSGIEIPAADLPRIFDKFYRVPSPDLWQYGGTGLGLALVKRLAEHLGAQIWADSSHQQVIFTLMLPLEL